MVNPPESTFWEKGGDKMFKRKSILTIIIILSIISAQETQADAHKLIQVTNKNNIIQYELKNANEAFSDSNLITQEKQKTEKEPVNLLVLPSLSGLQSAIYADYSAGDTKIDRVNTGQLVNSTDTEIWELNPISGPLRGVFSFSLTWNEEEGESIDIDLYPGCH